MTVPPQVCFTEAEANAAHDDWGLNCGPGAVAGVLGLTLKELRPHLGEFESKGYTNPTLMWSILRSLEANWRQASTIGIAARGIGRPPWPRYGLARVQWEGPWTQPGVNPKARYRYTHWVGSCVSGNNGVGIFDINCMNSGGWISLDHWASIVVPHLLVQYPRATGGWHLTHLVEIDLDGKRTKR